MLKVTSKSAPAHPLPEAGLSIAEAARRTGVSVHTLRYYQRAGLVVHKIDVYRGRVAAGDADQLWCAPACLMTSDRVWAGSMPQAYDRWLAPAVFRPFAVDLARRAATFAPRRLLEIAAGTGVLTRELVAAVPAAQVTATDLNAAMVEFGSRQVPRATWRQADALRLPFDDQTFDLVALPVRGHVLPGPARGFRRDAAGAGAGGQAAVQHLGRRRDARLRGGPGRPGSATCSPTTPRRSWSRCRTATATSTRSPPTWPRAGWNACPPPPSRSRDDAASAADVAAGFCTGTPLRAAIEARGDLAACTALVADQMTARLGPGPVTATMTAYVIEARAAGAPACDGSGARPGRPWSSRSARDRMSPCAPVVITPNDPAPRAAALGADAR